MLKNPKSVVMSAALVAVSLLVGCGSEGSDGERTDTSQDALSQSIPKDEWFAIELDAKSNAGPAAVTQSIRPQTTPAVPACVSGTPAGFAQLSRQISTDANGAVAHVTSLIGQITSQPPAARTPTHAAWGPITDPASPSVYRFDVERIDANVFAFQLAGRPKAGDESTWRRILGGTVAPIDATHRAGEAHLDFGAAHAVNPANEPAEGGLALRFEATDDARKIELAFAGVKRTGEATANDAKYTFLQPKDGVATFDFVTRTDFDKDGKQDEILHVQSRWNVAAGGQAVVTIVDGSLPKPVTATECWDAKGGAVFYADDAAVHPPAGEAACCPK